MGGQLLLDTVTLSPQLTESIKELPDGRLRVTGKFQHCDLVNRNNRIYPRRVWERHCSPGSEFVRALKERRVFGHLEHPKDGKSDLKEAAVVITEICLRENGEIWGTLETLSTSLGETAKSIIKDGLTIGVSSRARGSVRRNSQGVDEVQEDFQPETFDLVAEPSTPGAELHESVQRNLEERGADAIRLEEARAKFDVQFAALKEDVMSSRRWDPRWLSRYNDLQYYARGIEDLQFPMRMLKDALDLRESSIGRAENDWRIAKSRDDIGYAPQFTVRSPFMCSSAERENAPKTLRVATGATVYITGIYDSMHRPLPAGRKYGISYVTLAVDASFLDGATDQKSSAISAGGGEFVRERLRSPASIVVELQDLMSATGLDEQKITVGLIGKRREGVKRNMMRLVEQANGAAKEAKAAAKDAEEAAKVAVAVSKEKVDPKVGPAVASADVASVEAKVAAAGAEAAAEAAKKAETPEAKEKAAEIAQEEAEKANTAADAAQVKAESISTPRKHYTTKHSPRSHTRREVRLLRLAENAAQDAQVSADMAAQAAQSVAATAQEKVKPAEAEVAAVEAEVAAAKADAAKKAAGEAETDDGVQAAAQIAKEEADKAQAAADQASSVEAEVVPDVTASATVPAEIPKEPVEEVPMEDEPTEAEPAPTTTTTTVVTQAEAAARRQVEKELREEVKNLRRQLYASQTENQNLRTLNQAMVELFESEMIRFEVDALVRKYPELEPLRESLLKNKTMPALHEMAKDFRKALRGPQPPKKTGRQRFRTYTPETGNRRITEQMTIPDRLEEDFVATGTSVTDGVTPRKEPEDMITRLKKHRERKVPE